MSELDPPGGPDSELEAFYAAERARPVSTDAGRHAALARVLAAAIPVPAPVPSPGIGRGAAAATALATLVLGVVIGAIGHAVLVERGDAPTHDPPREDRAITEIVAPPIPPPPITASVEPPAVAPAPEVMPAPEDVAAEMPPTRPVEPLAEPEGDEGLASEMALVARAQTALHRGLYESALGALDEHARRFPRGELTEEREALAVQALARAGRHDEARRRAERFEARHPRSLLVPVVRAAVAHAPEGTAEGASP